MGSADCSRSALVKSTGELELRLSQEGMMVLALWNTLRFKTCGFIPMGKRL
jgi:hypothetical protein